MKYWIKIRDAQGVSATLGVADWVHARLSLSALNKNRNLQVLDHNIGLPDEEDMAIAREMNSKETA